MGKISIVVIIAFAIFLGLFSLNQVPIVITEDEVLAAVDDAIAESGTVVDEKAVEQQVADRAEQILEARQVRRLKFLVSAYFIVWLIFILYAVRLSKAQDDLRKRLEQLEAASQRKGS